MCWRRFQGMSRRRLQDVLKTNKCLVGCCSKKISFIKLKEAYKYKGKKNKKEMKGVNDNASAFIEKKQQKKPNS